MPSPAPPSHSSHWPLTILMGLSSLLNIFLPLLLVRLLTPTEVGLYKVFFLYAVTAPWILLSAGFGNGLYYWAGQGRERARATDASFGLQLAWAGAVLAAGLLAHRPLAAWLGWEPALAVYLVLAAAAAIPANFFEDFSVSRGAVRRAAWFGAAFEGFRTLALVAAAVYFRRADAIFLTHLACVGVKLGTASSLALRAGVRPRLSSNPLLRPVLRYALPSSLSTGLLVIVNYADQMLLGQRLSAPDFAAYSLGCLSVPPLLIFEQSVNKVLIPELARRLRDGAPPRPLFRATVLELGLWLIPAVAGLYFFAEPITQLLFTSRYPAAAGYLRLYAFFYLSYVVPYDAWARASGNSAWVLRTMLLFAGLAVGSVLLGVRLGGATGALVGFLTVQGALRAYSVRWMESQAGGAGLIPGRKLLLLLAWAAATGITARAVTAFLPTPLAGLLAGGAIFTALYLALAFPLVQAWRRRERRAPRVLMLTQFLHVGGLERMVLNLSQTIPERGWSAHVLAYDELPGVEKLDGAFAGLPLHRLRKGPGFSPRLVFEIVSYTRRHGIDVIHAHDIGPLLYATLARLLSGGRLAVVFTQHSFVHLQAKRRYRYYEQIFSRLAGQICVVSEPLREGYRALGVPSRLVRVVENGVPYPPLLSGRAEQAALRRALWPEAPAGAGEAVWLLSLARLHPGKGQENLIEIWARLPEKSRRRAYLLFVGGETEPGYRRRLEALAAAAPSPERLIFRGTSSRAPSWVQAADAFVSASAQEGLPLGPIEALGAGLPAFLSDIEGHRELGGTPVYFSLSDPAAAAATFATLIANLEEARTRPLAPLVDDSLRQRFSLARMRDEYVACYEQV